MQARTHNFGLLMTLVMAVALAMPMASFSPNRIAMGKGLSVFDAAPPTWAVLLLVAVAITAAAAVFSPKAPPRFLAAGGSLLLLILAMGHSGTMLLAQSTPYARVSPAAGFWLLAFALAMILTDSVVRLRLTPRARLGILGGTLALLGGVLLSGQLDALSIMTEYDHRAETFWQEARHHLQLALGSLGLAAIIGIPVGILVHRIKPLQATLLNALSLLQTIPSMALFGILIAPLGWLATHVEFVHALGIRGIGMAPAFVALFLYSLLPMVANTTAGLNSVGTDICEAANGMGMTPRQRLMQVELPLALPVILTGVRIVLVQNIGLATIAALIGGGGFGVFVFQGLGQTATDLILLGALPTVGLAFIASVCLNVMIDLSQRSAP